MGEPRICAYPKCPRDLDKLGKRPNAIFCSKEHSDGMAKLTAQRRSEARRERDRATRALTTSFARIEHRFYEHRINEGDPHVVALARAKDFARSTLTDTQRAEYDRRRGRVAA